MAGVAGWGQGRIRMIHLLTVEIVTTEIIGIIKDLVAFGYFYVKYLLRDANHCITTASPGNSNLGQGMSLGTQVFIHLSLLQATQDYGSCVSEGSLKGLNSWR